MDRWPHIAAAIGLAASFVASAVADPSPAFGQRLCREVRVAFAPDCFRSNLQAPCNPRKNGAQLDLGPQIAIWVQSAQGQFVDTVMVTSLVGTRGLGNRPGRWSFPSAPRFPYGRRLSALPIWAFSRGQLYDLVVFQDGREAWLGFHESASSPDPYYCRPMTLAEVDVDAVSCPTAVFNSAKGRFDPHQKTPYPPRNDLAAFTDRDCDQAFAQDPRLCVRSAEAFAGVNDLDAVSRATPPFGQVHEVRRVLPGPLTPGPHVIRVEVNKEFDQNDFHRYAADPDPQLPESGIETNLGQPSVLFEVPIEIADQPAYASAMSITGYGAWDGRDGRIHPPDDTISRSPGSGEGRLMAVADPWSGGHPPARVHVSTVGCDLAVPGQPSDGGLASPCVPPSPPHQMVAGAIGPTTATFTFFHGGDANGAVAEYLVRYREGDRLDDADFLQAIPAPTVLPGSPGSEASIHLTSLKPLTRYVLAVQAISGCGAKASLVAAAFETKPVVYAQLSGCFVATAALGTPLAPELPVLRGLRDRVLASGRVGGALVETYYRAAPPLADVIADSPVAGALARAALAPLFHLTRSITKPETDIGRPARSR